MRAGQQRGDAEAGRRFPLATGQKPSVTKGNAKGEHGSARQSRAETSGRPSAPSGNRNRARPRRCRGLMRREARPAGGKAHLGQHHRPGHSAISTPDKQGPLAALVELQLVIGLEDPPW